ncbi:MAG: LLM class flavin-dependent oxidoreductase, partial [bacterium]|nr:LLM class flavin-dependent oxidoreductase [bacterium]
MSGLSVGLAVAAGTTPSNWARTLRLVERADRLGMHSVWLPEHHFHPNATPSPLVTLTAFAARTEQVRLATTSLLLPVQHPLHVAAQVALLDQLSGGRVLLGLGRGFRPPLFRAFGVAAKTKRDRFDEALDTMLAAWTGTAFEQGGQYYGTGAVHLGLRPAQQPHPPLVVAAFGPKGLAQAARRGLPYLASPLEGLPALAENYAFWRDHCHADPDPRAPSVPVMRTAFLAEDDRTAARVRAALEGEQRIVPAGRPNKALTRAAAGPLEDRVLVGTRTQVEDRIGHYREQLGLDLLVVRTEVPGASDGEREASLD